MPGTHPPRKIVLPRLHPHSPTPIVRCLLTFSPFNKTSDALRSLTHSPFQRPTCPLFIVTHFFLFDPSLLLRLGSLSGFFLSYHHALFSCLLVDKYNSPCRPLFRSLFHDGDGSCHLIKQKAAEQTRSLCRALRASYTSSLDLVIRQSSQSQPLARR